VGDTRYLSVCDRVSAAATLYVTAPGVERADTIARGCISELRLSPAGGIGAAGWFE